MISINFDTNVLMAQRNVNIASNLVNEALQRLTTGFRINSAADDPAGYYFASDLNTELRALSVAQQNIADGVTFMTTAQDSLFNMGDIINRLKDLALQGSNSTLDSSQRTAIQKETDALLEELFKLKNESTFRIGGIVKKVAFPETVEELIKIPGIGVKTANCYLVDILDKPGVIVDTHFARVVHRLGLTSTDDRDKVYREIRKEFDPSMWSRLSMTANLHGRKYCKARSPLCSTCFLSSICPSKAFFCKGI